MYNMFLRKPSVMHIEDFEIFKNFHIMGSDIQ